MGLTLELGYIEPLRDGDNDVEGFIEGLMEGCSVGCNFMRKRYREKVRNI